jgi:hypothetical protein
MSSDCELPRLVYIGDVPVESSYHGSLLLYRLFSGYPPEKLLVVETDFAPSHPERRLPNTQYGKLAIRRSRLTRSRFSKLYSIWLFLSARHRVRKAMRVIGNFRPNAVISVAHGYHWVTAARAARRLSVPLHLIVHDHVVQLTPVPVFVRPCLDSIFGRIYRQAETRLCISPAMEDEYAKRYGAGGTVLYPSRAADCPKWEVPPERSRTTQGLRIAFAGTINSGGMAWLLRLLAQSLQSEDRLVLFGPHSVESLRFWNLERENVTVGGLLPSMELLQRLRSDFDLLYVPMSFDIEGHVDNTRLSFPSKLADYTATGLPMLICGPEYSSAVRWARENQPVAEVVTDQGSQSLREALDRLASPQHREMLGRRALEIGEKFFSHEAAESVFFGALSGAASKIGSGGRERSASADR